MELTANTALGLLNWTLAGESATIFIGTLLLHRFMFPIGAVIFASIMAPHMIPGFGRIYHYLIQGPVKLLFPVKVASWLVSGTGALLACALLKMWIKLEWQHWHYIALLLAAVLAFLTAGSRVLELTVVPPANEIISSVGEFRIMTGAIEAMDLGDKDRLARMHFVDMLMAQLFGLLTVGGLIFYSLGHLGILELLQPRSELTLWNAQMVAWSMGNIFGGSDLYKGINWQIVRAIFQLCLFLWITVFLQLGTSLIDREMDRGKNISNRGSLPSDEAELKGFINREVERLQLEERREAGLSSLQKFRSAKRMRPCRPSKRSRTSRLGRQNYSALSTNTTSQRHQVSRVEA